MLQSMYCHLTGVTNSFSAWEPTDKEVELLQQNPKRRRLTANSTIGDQTHVAGIV